MGQTIPPEDLAPSSCQLVPFKDAVIKVCASAGPLLVVSGIAPSTKMEIFLSHRDYRHQPDWWGIEVIGAFPGGICLTETRKYETAIPVSDILGTEGIEVIGANRTVRLSL